MSVGLGGATFQVRADPAQFKLTMKSTEALARASAASIGSSMEHIEHATVRSSRGAAQGLLSLSRAVDDAQYGFRAIVNNIPEIVYMFGGTAGIAGAVGIASVAVNILINHWKDLIDTFQGAWSGVPAAQLEELRLKAEAATEAFEKLSKTPTKAEAAEAKGVSEAITEAGTAKLATVLAVRIAQDPTRKAAMEAEQKKEEERVSQTLALGGQPLNVRTPEQIQKDQNEENYKKAIELAGNAVKEGVLGDKARLDLKKIAPEIADQIEAASPAGKERIKQAQLEAEGARNDRKMIEKLEKEKMDERQQQAVWEAKGRQNEREWEKKQDAKREREQAERDRAHAAALFKKAPEVPYLDRIETGQFQSTGIADFAKMSQRNALEFPSKQLEEARKQTELLIKINEALAPDQHLMLGSPAALAAVPN